MSWKVFRKLLFTLTKIIQSNKLSQEKYLNSNVVVSKRPHLPFFVEINISLSSVYKIGSVIIEDFVNPNFEIVILVIAKQIRRYYRKEWKFLFMLWSSVRNAKYNYYYRCVIQVTKFANILDMYIEIYSRSITLLI